MKFSVIIPTFNRAYCLERAIDSVLNQSFKDFELIIVDDGSTDDTVEVLKKYQNKISYIKTKNLGVSHARNVGIKKSRGEWIALLDSDDEWHENKLELQNKFISENPNIPLVHGEEIWIRRGKRVNPKNKHKKFGGYIFEKCLPLCLISPSASVIKKEILLEVGAFDENFIVCEDYDLWLKITSKYEVGFIETPIISKYGGHEDQLSAKYFAMDLYRVRALNNILRTRKLSETHINAVKNQIKIKAEILINGYRKHKNFENIDEVLKIVGML